MKKYNNQISTTIREQDMEEILKAIEFIEKKLSNLVLLSKEEAMSLPKMHGDTIEFVSVCLQEAKKNPEAVPENIEINEVKKDLELYKAISKISSPLKSLMRKLNDSALLASSEAYLPAIAIHNAIATWEYRVKANSLN